MNNLNALHTMIAQSLLSYCAGIGKDIHKVSKGDAVVAQVVMDNLALAVQSGAAIDGHPSHAVIGLALAQIMADLSVKQFTPE